MSKEGWKEGVKKEGKIYIELKIIVHLRLIGKVKHIVLVQMKQIRTRATTPWGDVYPCLNLFTYSYRLGAHIQTILK